MVQAPTMLRDTGPGQFRRNLSPTINRVDRTDEVRIDLIRDLAPQHLILFGDRQIDHEEWARHCRQQTEHILAATRGPATARRVVGTLELRLLPEGNGVGGRLDRLYVDPAYRRQGIASRLLRAAIHFGRARGLVALREHIPNVLVREPASRLWFPYLPAGEGWGGLRSLGATANACADEGLPCAIERASRPNSTRIGAIVALPLARATKWDDHDGAQRMSRAESLDRLIGDLARAAGVPLVQQVAPALAS